MLNVLAVDSELVLALNGLFVMHALVHTHTHISEILGTVWAASESELWCVALSPLLQLAKSLSTVLWFFIPRYNCFFIFFSLVKHFFTSTQHRTNLFTSAPQFQFQSTFHSNERGIGFCGMDVGESKHDSRCNLWKHKYFWFRDCFSARLFFNQNVILRQYLPSIFTKFISKKLEIHDVWLAIYNKLNTRSERKRATSEFDAIDCVVMCGSMAMLTS